MTVAVLCLEDGQNSPLSPDFYPSFVAILCDYWTCCGPTPHSQRMALTGLTEVARRAGMYAPNRSTATIKTAAPDG
jgi:hypothetical protein